MEIESDIKKDTKIILEKNRETGSFLLKAYREDCTIPASGDVRKAAAAQCDLVMPGRSDQWDVLQKGLERQIEYNVIEWLDGA